MKKFNLLIMILIISIISAIMILSCVTTSADDSSNSKTNSSTSSVSSTTSSVSSTTSSVSSTTSSVSSTTSSVSSTTSSTVSSQSAIFIETFNNVPDNTDIRDNVNLDNPASFTNSNFSGEIRAGFLVSGSGSIAMCNTNTTANSQRMAFIIPGLSGMAAPVLKLTIKNDNGSGAAVSNLMINIGNSYTTNGSVGVSGQRAYGEYLITNTTYQVMTFALNTSFTSTNIIQIRPVVNNSSTGAGGIYIDKIVIEETGASSSVSSTPSSSSSMSYSLPSSGSPIGFATAGAGTNGGAGGDIKYASTGTELQNYINIYKTTNPDGRPTRTSPRIIYVTGTINPANSSGLTKIDIKGSADDEMYENISIIGVGTSGELNGIGIKIWRGKNIIIQNLKIHHVNIGDKDCIGIEGPASNIWVDHCELYSTDPAIQTDGDYYDGLLDAKDTSEYITVSWTYFHDHWKTSLVGSSDSDIFDRKITYHHNYFYNCNSRLPSYRTGQGHVFNNYYNLVMTGAVNSRVAATLRVEGNYFENVHDPICAKDSPAGYWDLGDGTNVDTNTYDTCTWETTTATEYTNASILGFVDTCTYTPPYTYTLTSSNQAKTDVLANAGVGKL